MKRIRIGIIGSGFMAKTHAVSFTKYLDSAELVGFAGGSRAPALAQEFDVKAFAEPADLLSSDEVDAVVITTPHAQHLDQALPVAKAGMHLLLEKPMATTLDQCRQIIQAFADRDKVLMIAYTQRFRTANRMARDIIASGEIGQVTMISEWGLVAGGLDNYPTWQRQPENLGILFGYGCHNLDKLRWFLESEPVSVTGLTRLSHSGVETTAMGTYAFQNGAMAQIWTGVDLPRPGFERSAYRSRVVGTEGLLDVDGYGALRVCPGGSDWETRFVQPAIDWQGEGAFSDTRMGSFNTQNQEFLDAIHENRPATVSGQDGMASVHMALGLYQAAATNTVYHFDTN